MRESPSSNRWSGRLVERIAVGTPEDRHRAARLRPRRSSRTSWEERPATRVPYPSANGATRSRRRPWGSATQRPGTLLRLRVGPGGVLHPSAEGRLLLDAVLLALEPVVPPAQALLKEADLRARDGEVRILCAHGPISALSRARQALQQPRHRVRVAVRPAADGVDRALDGGDSPRRPSRAARRRRGADACSQPRSRAASLQPLQPHLPPALADQRGSGGARSAANMIERPGAGSR